MKNNDKVLITGDITVLDKDMHEGGFGKMSTYEKVDGSIESKRCCEWHIKSRNTDAKLNIACNEPHYLEHAAKCVFLFNQLKNALNTEQKELLHLYEEATAAKENVLLENLFIY